jgi:2-polyprenyl-3-methyl-5-hydroxy-6-metoxy-1,4-benzoquinol methylase
LTDGPCAHAVERTVLASADYITRERFELRRCEACGLVRTHPRPADIDRFYPGGYYGAGERYGPLATALLARVHAARAARLTRLHGGPGRVLDLGCGPGLLLDALRRRGWSAVGIERSAAAAAFARDRLGLDVRVGEWQDSGVREGEIDAVILWHVLEHLASPGECLQWAVDRLKPGGVALLAAPDLGSPEARWAGEKWFHLDVPRHLTHFTRATLAALAARSRLEIVATSSFAPEYDLFSFVQSTLNAAGLAPNALYNFVRKGDARVLASAPAWDTVASVVLSVPLAPIGAIATTIAGLRGAGATITLYCRKAQG